MSHLLPSEVGDLKLVVNGYELTGKVKNVEVAADIDYDNVEDGWSTRLYRSSEKYTISAEFVLDDKGVAYTIKELPKMEPVTYTAETFIDANWDRDTIKAARKRVGAPKGSAYTVMSGQSGALIKFEWVDES